MRPLDMFLKKASMNTRPQPSQAPALVPNLAIRVILYVVAAALLGAHFYRAGDYLLVGLCVATPLCFLIRNLWSLILLQFAAYSAAAIWIATALQLVIYRQQLGRPWTAAAIILAGVALLSLVSGLLLNSSGLRDHYRNRAAQAA